ncbi:gigaxonin-like isoform X2 [Macrobrachium nipponense]
MSRQEYSTSGLHATRILKELSSLRKLEVLCDGSVKLLDGNMKVSRAILAAGCPYFKALFTFEEEVQHGVHSTAEPVLDITVQSFEIILNYIYTGKISLDNDNIQDILQASDLLLMNDLKELCIQYLMMKTDVDNCLGIYQFAQQFSCPRLVHFAQDFIFQHFRHRQIVRTDEFRNLGEERLKSLLAQDGLMVKSELDILTALVVWLNENGSKNPDVESLVTNCLRESADLKYDPRFQQALQDLKAGKPPWDSPGAEMVRDALKKTRRIRSIRQRGMKTVLACCDDGDVFLVNILSACQYGSTSRKLPPMLHPRIRPSIITMGGYLFVMGGGNQNQEMCNEVQKYDPQTNSWTLMAPMPYSCFSPKVVAYSGKLYVTGGVGLYEQELQISRFEEFDIYANKWRTLPSVPNPRRGTALVVANNKIYYIGGSPWQEYPDGVQFLRVVDAVDYFCLTEETWVAGPQLKERRSHATAVCSDENVFVFGGTRPIECPSAHGSLKVTGTEALFYASSQNWTPLGGFAVPIDARFQPTALATNEFVLLIGKNDPTDKRHNAFIMGSTGWSLIPSGNSESILTSGARRFCGFSLLTLPAAAMQDLQVESDT